MRCAVVIEKAGDNFSGLCARPARLHRDGRNLSETDGKIREAIRFHIEGLKTEGLPIPELACLSSA